MVDITNTAVTLKRKWPFYVEDYNGTASKLVVSWTYTVKSICFWIYPKSTTVKILEWSANANLIHINSWTLTYTDFDNAYINWVDTNTLVANKWQFVTIISTTDVAFNAMTIWINNTTYWSMQLSMERLYNRELALAEHTQLYTSQKPFFI